MTGKLKKQRTNFTTVTNRVLRDSTLSLKAKGMYAYIYSKPEGWDFAIRRIANEHSDGVESCGNAIRELERAGYIKREKQNTGRVLYHILVEPITYLEPDTGNPYEANPDTGNPDQGFPNLGKPQSGETRTISKKEGEQERGGSKKDIYKGNIRKITDKAYRKSLSV